MDILHPTLPRSNSDTNLFKTPHESSVSESTLKFSIRSMDLAAKPADIAKAPTLDLEEIRFQEEMKNWVVLNEEDMQQGIIGIQQAISQEDAQELIEGLSTHGIEVPAFETFLAENEGNQEKAIQAYIQALQAQLDGDKAKQSKVADWMRTFVANKLQADPSNPTWKALEAALGRQGSLVSNLFNANNICAAGGIATVGLLILISSNPVLWAAGGTYAGASTFAAIAQWLVMNPSIGMIFYSIGQSSTVTASVLSASGSAFYFIPTTVRAITNIISWPISKTYGALTKQSPTQNKNV